MCWGLAASRFFGFSGAICLVDGAGFPFCCVCGCCRFRGGGGVVYGGFFLVFGVVFFWRCIPTGVGARRLWSLFAVFFFLVYFLIWVTYLVRFNNIFLWPLKKKNKYVVKQFVVILFLEATW
ncbi:hypothetical protein Ancab_032562 [Ancistrocladus abbreviatus]